MRTDEILKRVTGPAVLDVGCAGHIIKPKSPYWLHGRLREQFPSLVGIDLHKDNVARLRELGFENVHVASAENFDLDSKFDTIVAGELIEHLSNPSMFLNRCHLHLKPGGRVVITTPYVFSLLYVLYAYVKFPNTCQNNEHTTWFCPQTLSELVARSGLTVKEWEIVEDYEMENSSMLYRIFALFISTLGKFLIPARLRKNNMIFVCTKIDSGR